MMCLISKSVLYGFSDEKLSAAEFLLESFGGCSTSQNKTASRFLKSVSLDFDNYGRLTCANFQVSECSDCNKHTTIQAFISSP